MRYRVNTGLTYPTDPVVGDALRELGATATAAAKLAIETGDQRDVDAAVTAERARLETIQALLADGSLKRVESGEVVDDIPAASLPWLLEQGHIASSDSQTVAPVAVESATQPADAPSGTIDEATWRDLGRPADGQ